MEKLFNIKVKKREIGGFPIDPDNAPQWTLLHKRVPQDFDRFTHIGFAHIPTSERGGEHYKLIVIDGEIQNGRYIIDRSRPLRPVASIQDALKFYQQMLQEAVEDSFVKNEELYTKKGEIVEIPVMEHFGRHGMQSFNTDKFLGIEKKQEFNQEDFTDEIQTTNGTGTTKNPLKLLKTLASQIATSTGASQVNIATSKT